MTDSLPESIQALKLNTENQKNNSDNLNSQNNINNDPEQQASPSSSDSAIANVNEKSSGDNKNNVPVGKPVATKYTRNHRRRSSTNNNHVGQSYDSAGLAASKGSPELINPDQVDNDAFRSRKLSGNFINEGMYVFYQKVGKHLVNFWTFY